MSPRKVLVVYYSRTGRTQQLADEIARAVGDCDVELIRDGVNRRGLRGYLLSGYQARRGIPTKLEPISHDPRAYDLVIVGTPVWVSSVSVPVRSYLMANVGRLRNVAFFLTHGSTGRERVFRQMTALAHLEPIATLAVRERDFRRRRFVAPVKELVQKIQKRLPIVRPVLEARGIAV